MTPAPTDAHTCQQAKKWHLVSPNTRCRYRNDPTPLYIPLLPEGNPLNFFTDYTAHLPMIQRCKARHKTSVLGYGYFTISQKISQVPVCLLCLPRGNCMNKYARIGRPCLIQAIGPQENHTVIELRDTDEVDRERNCCFVCPYYKALHMESYSVMPKNMQAEMDKACANCPDCVYKKTAVKHYINEQNRYGYLPRLGLVPTKILICCHFAGPDKNGLVKNVCITEFAQAAGCSRRSVLDAFERLSNLGYLMYGHCGRGLVNVVIPSYRDIGLPAEKGGRGYITLNQEMFQKVMACDNVVQLRVMIRILLDTDTSKDGTASEDMQVFRRFLPSYCKPGIIRKALDKTGFRLMYRETGEIKVRLEKEDCGRACFQEAFQKALSEIKAHLLAVCSDMEGANRKITVHKAIGPEKRRLKKEGYTIDVNTGGMKFYVPFRFTDQDIKDLAYVAASYSVNEVKKALLFVYNNYQVRFKQYRPGALVRSIIQYGEVAWDA